MQILAIILASVVLCTSRGLCLLVESGWWQAPEGTAEASSQTGDEHGQLLLPLLYVQHKWWNLRQISYAVESCIKAQIKKDWIIYLSACLFPCCFILSLCRGFEPGWHSWSGCPHGWPVLHWTGAQHHFQTKLDFSQPQQRTTASPWGPQCQYQAHRRQWSGEQWRYRIMCKYAVQQKLCAKVSLWGEKSQMYSRKFS